jgi:DNA-binding transcriptional regulator PaaX
MGRNFKYKGVTVNTFGLPVSRSKKDKIKRTELMGKRYNQYKHFIHNFTDKAPKNLIVMYDIPSDKRKERDWFRRHLQKFDYIMIQKSVWVGPSPLPVDFLSYVKSIGLLNKLRTFKLAKSYSANGNDR